MTETRLTEAASDCSRRPWTCSRHAIQNKRSESPRWGASKHQTKEAQPQQPYVQLRELAASARMSALTAMRSSLFPLLIVRQSSYRTGSYLKRPRALWCGLPVLLRRTYSLPGHGADIAVRPRKRGRGTGAWARLTGIASKKPTLPRKHRFVHVEVWHTYGYIYTYVGIYARTVRKSMRLHRQACSSRSPGHRLSES